MNRIYLKVILGIVIPIFFVSCDNENVVVDNGHITDSIKEDATHKDTIYQDTIKSKIYNFCLADIPISAKKLRPYIYRLCTLS